MISIKHLYETLQHNMNITMNIISVGILLNVEVFASSEITGHILGAGDHVHGDACDDVRVSACSGSVHLTRTRAFSSCLGSSPPRLALSGRSLRSRGRQCDACPPASPSSCNTEAGHYALSCPRSLSASLSGLRSSRVCIDSRFHF